MGANGRTAFLKDFSIERGVEDYEKVLLDLIAGSGFA